LVLRTTTGSHYRATEKRASSDGGDVPVPSKAAL
jgi:hypothetical protein